MKSYSSTKPGRKEAKKTVVSKMSKKHGNTAKNVVDVKKIKERLAPQKLKSARSKKNPYGKE